MLEGDDAEHLNLNGQKVALRYDGYEWVPQMIRDHAYGQISREHLVLPADFYNDFSDRVDTASLKELIGVSSFSELYQAEGLHKARKSELRSQCAKICWTLALLVAGVALFTFCGGHSAAVNALVRSGSSMDKLFFNVLLGGAEVLTVTLAVNAIWLTQYSAGACAMGSKIRRNRAIQTRHALIDVLPLDIKTRLQAGR